MGGLAEAVKAALIKDHTFFEFIEERAALLAARDRTAMEEVVHRSAALHLHHIATAGDPFEMGSSRPLDFGHWAAHKLERLTSHQLRHGEAVAIGLALDTTYSYLSGFLAESDWRRVIGLLGGLGLAVYAPELGHRAGDQPAILRGLDEFREHLGGRLTIMLLRAIGVPFDAHEIDKGVMLGSVEVLRSLEDARRAGSPEIKDLRRKAEAQTEGGSNQIKDGMDSRSPLSPRDVVDEYFIENRTRLLEIAAFLDRLDRTEPGYSGRDFRMQAFTEALAAMSGGSGRLERIQLLLSDPTTEPLGALDRKSAFGASTIGSSGKRRTVSCARSIYNAAGPQEMSASV